MKKFVLIDGNSLLNRAFYATPLFTTANGIPTNGIFGFIKLLFKILDEMKPEYIAVAFDLKAPTFRHKMYDGYKATRKPMPDELAAQVAPLKNLLKAMKIATCEKEGFEADDLIGTLSHIYDVHSYIYTGDRDSYQLVDEKTDVHYTKKGVADLLKLNISNFKQEVGIEPKQVIDLKSLMGDKSDNIPGVAGVGEKTALGLIADYGSLDGVYEHIDELKGSLKEKLVNNRELAYTSYKLATIDRNCEVNLKLEDCVAPDKYGADVKKLFSEFEFRSFLAMNIFGEDSAQSIEINYPEKIEIKKEEQFDAVLAKNSEFCVDIGENYAEIFTAGKQYSVKIQEGLLVAEGLNYEQFSSVLKTVFSNENNTVTAYNCKSLMHLLAGFGVDFKCRYNDLSIAIYLCDGNGANLTFKDVCEINLYNYEYSAFAVSELFKKYYKTLENSGLVKLYTDVEKPLLEILFEMERAGVRVSFEHMDELSKTYEKIIGEYKEKVFSQCGCTFNLNSPSQLGEVLYTKLGITAVKKKKTGKYSTSAEILEKLTDEYPVIKDILKFRQYQKLQSTYLDGLRPLIDRKTQLVHTTYTQTVTTTGRLSSVNPNLQNIPVRNEEGREIRKIFIPREGNIFIDADYSQIELRLLAHFSGCKELVDAYKNGVDVHSVTAAQVFGVDLENVTPEMRRQAKAVNFGIIYGISDFGLSKNLNIAVGTAKGYIEKYFETYSAVKEYMNKNVEFAREHGYVSTLTGRKRTIPEIKSSNYAVRQFGERAAMNMPLQGSSADIIKIAMINVASSLKKHGLKTKLIMQVHDELILDAPESEAERAAEILKYEMENAVALSVPLTVEVHTGKNLYNAK